MNFRDLIEFVFEVACATVVVALLGGLLYGLLEGMRYVVA